MTRQEEKDRAYMAMADDFGQLSHAVRAKVGCVIVSDKGQIISQGYNGTPSGRDNSCEYVGEDGELHTKAEVLHAESNAITKCAKWGSTTDGATLYVTLSPCMECSKLIIQSGIRRVVYKNLYRNGDGLDLLSDLGIKVDKIQ